MTFVDHTLPLRGFTVGVTAERKADELGALLARRGAEVLYGAAMHTVPLPEDGALAETTREVLSGPVDDVVAITGAGFRGWVEAAEQLGPGADLVERLRSAALFARGAKARGAVRGAGLPDPWTSPAESSAEVLEHLLDRGVAGRRMVVQVHGDPMRDFIEQLRSAGAEVIPVAVYRWTDPVDLPALDRLIEAVLAGSVDALPFTSAPAASNMFDRADRLDVGSRFRDVLRSRVLLACVGPVTAAPIAAQNLPYVQPERARTAALVRLVEERLAALRDQGDQR